MMNFNEDSEEKLEEDSRNLMETIEQAMRSPTEFSEDQILTQVADLCAMIYSYNKKEIFEQLATRGINIIPYILKNIKTAGLEVKRETLYGLCSAIERSPAFLTIEDAQAVWALIQENCHREVAIARWRLDDVREWLIRAYRLLWEKRRDLIPDALQRLIPIDVKQLKAFNSHLILYKEILGPLSQFGLTITFPSNWVGGTDTWLLWIDPALLDKLLEDLLHPDLLLAELKKKSSYREADWQVRECNWDMLSMVQALRTAFRGAPILLTEERLAHLITLAETHRSDVIDSIILIMLHEAMGSRPELMTPNITRVLLFLTAPQSKVREGGITFFIKLLQTCPQLMTEEAVHRLTDSFSDDSLGVQWALLQLNQVLLTVMPQFFNEASYAHLSKSLSNPHWIFRWQALLTFDLLIEQDPSLIREPEVDQISALTSDPNRYIKAAAEATYTRLKGRV